MPVYRPPQCVYTLVFCKLAFLLCFSRFFSPSLTKVLLPDLSSEYKLKMTEVQAMVEFSVELNKFYNVDLFQRGCVF